MGDAEEGEDKADPVPPASALPSRAKAPTAAVFGASFPKKVRKHIDQVRKRDPAKKEDLPTPSNSGVDAVRRIVEARVATGEGTPTTFAGEPAFSFRDGGVSYILRPNGEFWTILRNP